MANFGVLFERAVIHIIHRFIHSKRPKKPVKPWGLTGQMEKFVDFQMVKKRGFWFTEQL